MNESTLRRRAQRLGYRLEKSRAREWRLDNQLGYRLLDVEINGAALGQDFDASLEEIAHFIQEAA